MSLKPLRLSWLRVLMAAELTFALMVVGGLWLLRQQTLNGEGRMLDAVAEAMARQADRTIAAGTVVLRTTSDELSRGVLPPSGKEIDALLRERARLLPPGFRAIGAFGADGHRLATSRQAATALPSSMAGQGLFEAARGASAPQLLLSEPYVAPGDGLPAISLSMGWTDGAGRFAGVVVLVADPDFLAGGTGSLARHKDVEQALLRQDGGGQVRPLLGPELGVDVPQGLRRALSETPSAGLPRTTRVDIGSQDLLVATVPLKQLPLLQAVWRDEEEVLSSWNELAWLVGAFIAAMLSVTLGAGLRMARDQLRVDSLQESLTRSRKLEALGQLAGGVAHDFNNVLAALVGFGEMARKEAAEGSRQARHLDRVLQAAERGRQQVERILAFSRGQPRRSVSFSLQPVVQEVLDHISHAEHPRVRIEARLAASDRGVLGDPTATYEAVMNLCKNALQAMPDGGVLQVELDEVQVTTPRQTYDATLAPGAYLRLQVRDTGQGMGADVLARLFEPFFTTKGRQGGTGIGLAVVHGVVADLDGVIDVASTPGRGSLFTLWLPVSAQPVEPAVDDTAVPALGNGQTVLVVDDEPALVELAEEMLAELGYEPRGTVSSAEALQALRENPAGFDLLLTDEVMPEMNGTALARAAHELRPDLPIVLCSGYGGEQFEARVAAAGVRVVLAKPLTAHALARALQHALRDTLQR
jgi:signal transduction histidine kinase/CheY-like chemotaxis protein